MFPLLKAKSSLKVKIRHSIKEIDLECRPPQQLLVYLHKIVFQVVLSPQYSTVVIMFDGSAVVFGGGDSQTRN